MMQEVACCAKAHVQFRDRRVSPIEIIDYIADHDLWKAAQVRKYKEAQNRV